MELSLANILMAIMSGVALFIFLGFVILNVRHKWQIRHYRENKQKYRDKYKNENEFRAFDEVFAMPATQSPTALFVRLNLLLLFWITESIIEQWDNLYLWIAKPPAQKRS